MAALTSFSQTDARTLFAAYAERDPSLDPRTLQSIEPVLGGTVNSSYSVVFPGRQVFVRIYEEQDDAGARTEADRLQRLASRGVRTPAPLVRTDGSVVGTVHGKPVAVFPWRPGEIRRLGRVTAGDARRVGVALAEVHVAGSDLPAAVGRFEPGDLMVRLDRLARVPFPAIAAQASPLRGKLTAWVARRDLSLPKGFVHGDVFRDNVLWGEDGDISALLDFESAAFGVLAYDLMVTVLAWSFRDGLETGIARALVGGYESVRQLEPKEKAGLHAEACVAALRFTITRLTDAELRAAEAGMPPRRDKDWRRFALRLGTLEELGAEGLVRVLWE